MESAKNQEGKRRKKKSGHSGNDDVYHPHSGLPVAHAKLECVGSMGNIWRFRKLLPGVRLPHVDAVRESLRQYDLEPLQAMHAETIHKAKRNKVFQGGTMKGRVVVALDGVEFFESKVKECDACLTRVIDGETHYYHQGVACMTIGSDPHVILGVDHLHPRDGEDDDEGELTGGKRLIRHLYERHRHFAFINDVRAIGMDAVVRVKNKRLNLVKDALGLFQKCDSDAQ